jgi:phosphoribosylformylglycinamidine cyclo-ligase
MRKSYTYKKAGVDIEKAEQSLNRLKSKIAETNTSEVLSGVGLFGGFYELPVNNFSEPVLVSSTDGVGTKLKIAFLTGIHNSIGQDLVNHCINDISVCGAKPLFFLDYFGCGKLEEGIYESVLEGITTACKNAGIPLIGGETAEMPDFYQKKEYDLSGTIVGVVEKSKIIDGREIREGDNLVGVASNGLHTNGFTLARKVLLPHYQPSDFIQELDCTLCEELLKIHKNYYPLISKIINKFEIKGISHITGGGIIKNTQRLLRENLALQIDWKSWPVPSIFKLIEKTGNVPEEDMRQTFNLGIGLILVVNPVYVKNLLEWGRERNLEFYKIGRVYSG